MSQRAVQRVAVGDADHGAGEHGGGDSTYYVLYSSVGSPSLIGGVFQGARIESFEGQLLILRPHLGERVLATMSNQAWHKHGAKNEYSITAAKAWSAEMDRWKR